MVEGTAVRGGRRERKKTVAQATPQQDIEAALAEAMKVIEAQHSQIATAFDVIADAIIVIDERGIIESVNAAACDMFGRPAFDLVHHSVSKLMPESVNISFDRLAMAPRPTGSVQRARTNDRNMTGVDAKGRRFPISASFAAVPLSMDGRHRYITIIRDLTEDRAKEDQIRFLAYHDEITKLPNHLGVRSYLDSYFSSSAQQPLLLAQIALNNMSDLAASFGLEENHRYVTAFAQRLKRVFGSVLVIGRGFGNTFYLLLPQVEETRLEDHLETVIGDPIEVSDMQVAIDISVGTLRLPEQGSSTRDAIHHVAATLFEANSLPRYRGRPRLVGYAPSIIRSMRKRTRLVHQIRQAITNDEFSVYLQPRIDLQSGQWAGPKRWHDGASRTGL